jgi:Zn-dependent peptidase ImmA (M78 family)
MKEICKFIINNRIYTIYDVDKIEGKNSYVGQSNYDNRKVFIEKGTKKDMLLTLKHELMHVWLYENGHTNQDGQEIFDYEDMCELVALSNDSINRITKEYLKSKKYK